MQEQEVVNWLINLEGCGHPVTFNKLRDMVRLISIQNGGEEKCGKHWISRFLLRNPAIKSKVGQKLDHKRANAPSIEALKTWFDRFKEFVDLHKIKPENMWNMDENGCCLGITDNQRVIGGACTKCSIKKSPESREWVSSVNAVSAEGKKLPLLIIFAGKSCRTHGFLPKTIQTFTTLLR